MPLARYAVPSLQDPAAEHGETVSSRTRRKRRISNCSPVVKSPESSHGFFNNLKIK